LAGDSSKPFFLAVGIIKPHLPFGAPRKYLDLYAGVELPAIPHPARPEGPSTWHGSGEFMQYNRWGKDPREDAAFATNVRRHYAACVSYADAQVGRILTKLSQTGADRNTIVVLWGDHGWCLGEHAMWGKHNLFEEALRSPLIVVYPGMARPGESTDAVIETLDVFPTLCDLAGVPKPGFTQGVSLLPLLEDPDAAGHPAVAYWQNKTTIRTTTHRLIVHPQAVELYDHTTVEAETRDVATDHPDLVAHLRQVLRERLGER
jgi:iduronate 2-sulfatase